MADTEVRAYRPGDEVAINRGFNEVFGQGRGLAEWHWKFPEPPGGRPIMLTLDGDGTVLVHYAAVPIRVQIDGRLFAGGQIVDVYSRQEARRGLAAARAYVRNYDRFVERFCGPDGLAFCYGFPGDRALRLGLKRTAYDDIPPQPLQLWRRSHLRLPWLAPRHRVVAGFDAHAADLVWERSRRRYAVAVARDGAALARRYLGRPGVEYTHLVAWHGGLPEALAVVRACHEAVWLADLVWDGHRPGALAAVDRAIVKLARRWGTERLEMWLEADGAAGAVMRGLGWSAQDDPRGLHWVVRVFHPEIDWDGIPGRFYLTLGDSDLV